MITTDYLKRVYLEKLRRTGSMDAAFTKAWWIAYLAGASDALENKSADPLTTTNTLGYGVYIVNEKKVSRCGIL